MTRREMKAKVKDAIWSAPLGDGARQRELDDLAHDLLPEELLDNDDAYEYAVEQLFERLETFY